MLDQEIGEERTQKLEELRQLIAAAVDKVYDKVSKLFTNFVHFLSTKPASCFSVVGLLHRPWRLQEMPLGSKMKLLCANLTRKLHATPQTSSAASLAKKSSRPLSIRRATSQGFLSAVSCFYKTSCFKAPTTTLTSITN